MPVRRRARLIWLALAGLACQPASGNSVKPALVIDYYGDSTIWGYRSGNGEQVALTAPQAFAAALGGSARATVSNEGVNGSTACDLLNGSDGRHPPWAKQIAGTAARFVILNHGINDQWKYPLPQYKNCLRELVRIAKSRGKLVILETPNPTRDSAPDGLDLYAQGMRDVAAELGVPVIDQYSYLKDYLGGRPVQEICPDGLHPSDRVYELKGQYAARMFRTWYPALK